ncbi:MAG: hypothetical protein GY797_24270 [Deltaproteobacteria bacterium]|nr:hypothetical protein [Deltaproteobacteria bacterium]
MHPKINKETGLPTVETNRTRVIMVLLVAVILLIFWPGQQSLASTGAYVQEKNVTSSAMEYRDYSSAYCLHSPFVIGPGCGGYTGKKAILFVLRWVATHIQWGRSYLDHFKHFHLDVAKGLDCLDTLCMTK